MWREIVAAYPEARAATPADPAALDRAEAGLGQRLPPGLRALLLECDGVVGQTGEDVVWSAARILDDNLAFRRTPAFRSLYMPFEPLMFFGDDGGGDQFAFVRVPERDHDVFVWDHETDSRSFVAGNLEAYLRHALDPEEF
ncbi:SMI1/KNR4 family protein [Streptomyces sp. Act143]|uniref:SMI1/KNR4 family protein n=1 Tax=Streptomyces sp. Act143 TaxID=2200760 RepID=UPI000D683D62|nr:SMI1/KNR4 family protein [Streptomyces sp. Act143]PWI17437.1 SMI1/KNR4 family protein [Streptomyces sp. Act143]